MKTVELEALVALVLVVFFENINKLGIKNWRRSPIRKWFLELSDEEKMKVADKLISIIETESKNEMLHL